MADPSKDAQPQAARKTDDRGVINTGSGIVDISESAIGDHATVQVVVAAIAAGTLGPFITAFCTEMGKRFGGTVSDWAERVHLRRKRNALDTTELVIVADNAVTTIELAESLPDGAMRALLDLDIKTFRGHRLVWNAEAKAWIPAPPRA